MDRVIYTAAGGAARVLEQQTVLGNNMANLSTTGFREQLSNYRSVPLVAPQGLPTRVATVASTPGSNFEQGVMVETGSPLDMAIAGNGWFAVQTPTGQAYTRGGEFAVSSQGLLVNQQGYPVLSADNAPIEVPERGALTFASDGTITALGAGDNPTDIQVLGQLRLVNPPSAQLLRGDDGLFRTPAGAPPVQQEAGVSVRSGFVEKSNVSAAETMVGLIQNARMFEMQMKIIQDAGTNADKANSILSSNG